MTSKSQIALSITQLANTVSQIARQLQQIGLQLNALGRQVAQEQTALEQISQAQPSVPQTELLERFASLEDLVQQLNIRVQALERREVAFAAPLLPDAELEATEADTEDEPDEILWDFIEPVVPGSESKP